MRRLLLSVGLALVVGGATLGAAASLSINPTSLSAGSAVVSSCDTGTADVAWETTWYSGVTPGFYRVTGVTVSDLAPACAVMRARAVLRDSTNSMLHAWYGTWDGTSAFTFDFDQYDFLPAVNAADVSYIDVAISS
jgi:hypothetical protein